MSPCVILCYACVADCKMTPDGRNYAGKEAYGDKSFDCLNWTHVNTVCTPPYNLQDNNFPGGSIAGAVNYCRNPTHAVPGSGGRYHTLWCIYFVDKFRYCKYQTCGDTFVPICGECI